MLHLLDYSDFKDSIEVPFALSQMGIANAVAIARSNVPRAIAGLKEQGILVERQAHVKGVSRKRKAYFLTDSGIALARETWERLSEYPVRCIFEAQPAVDTTLGQAKSVLPFELRPVDIIRYIDEQNSLDLRSLSADLVERDLSKHVEKQLVTSLADLPRLRHFYGRATELDNMCNLLDARATLLVPGIAGIGKTTVASEIDRGGSCTVGTYSTIDAGMGKALGRSSNPLQIGCQAWVMLILLPTWPPPRFPSRRTLQRYLWNRWKGLPPWS